MGAPHWCADWVGSVGRVSLHPGRRGPRFAAVAASEPRRFAASARAAPWPTPAVRRTDGQPAAAHRAAPTLAKARDAARRLAAQPVARRCVARREARPPREVQAPGEARAPRELQGRPGPRAPPALLPVFLPVSAVARLRLSPAQQKR